MAQIKSTLGFIAKTASGEIPATTLATPPSVNREGVVENEPPADGSLWLVNARVFGASQRPDFIQFDPAQTQRNEAGEAVAQGGFIMRDGSAHTF